jgi:hypothetical protein
MDLELDLKKKMIKKHYFDRTNTFLDFIQSEIYFWFHRGSYNLFLFKKSQFRTRNPYLAFFLFTIIIVISKRAECEACCSIGIKNVTKSNFA